MFNMFLIEQKIDEYSKIQNKLYQFIKTYQSYASYDHADFKAHKVIVNLLKKVKAGDFTSKILLKLIYAGFYLFPLRARSLWGIKPTVLSGGLTNLLLALVEMAKQNPTSEMVEFRDDTANRLVELTIDCGDSVAWGLEYDWYSFELIPARTPIGYSTCMAATALFNLYKQTNDEKWLVLVLKSCEFFFTGLNHNHFSDNAIALSYTKLDNTMVVNSNALIAALLVDVYNLVNIDKYLLLAHKILKFVLEMQDQNGSWLYAKAGAPNIDHYHTAMTVQALIRIYSANVCNNQLQYQILDAITRATEFHLCHLFENQCPKITDKNSFPLSTILFMEDALLFDLLLDISADLNTDLVSRIKTQWIANIDYAIKHLLNPDGSFTAIYYPVFNNRFSMLRWSNAPILYALSLTLKRFSE